MLKKSSILFVISPKKEFSGFSQLSNNLKAIREQIKETDILPPVDEFYNLDSFQSNLTAKIILEIDVITNRYFDVHNPEKRGEIIQELFKYSKYCNYKVTEHILDFCSDAAVQTRAKMSTEIGDSILSLVIHFFPPTREIKAEDLVKYADATYNIGSNIAYDAAIYLKNLYLVMVGLTIMKLAYIRGAQRNEERITKNHEEFFSRLYSQMDRSNRPDLMKVKQMMSIFKEDLKNHDLSYPPLPPELMKETEN